jgi:chemosensory pili system protein ChpA (sensor histidine kinase/response regulator)
VQATSEFSTPADPAPQPLQLVHDELMVTLNEVRVSLEQFAEGELGTQPLERCAALLHTVRGVLQMTETHGASLLAEEMEQVCRHLLRHRRDVHAEDGLEAVLRAVEQLPVYVERIRNGGRDVPLVLLPLLNDLRAVRGRPLLSESTLLLLNLAPAAGTPGATERRASGEDIAALCRGLRPRFQLALLSWIRGDGAGVLPQLRSVAARLEAAAGNEVVHQLWWVVGGVLEALADGGLEASVSIKRLIGQADREMKRLFSVGEEHYASQPPVDLVNNLLYYVARATSTGPRVAAIREAFNLHGLIPGDEQVEAAREGLSAPSVMLMQTVAGAIGDDLTRVKDVLDIYVRTGMERVEELVPQVELLKKIGDTLGVLGLGDLREIVQEQRADLDALVSGATAATEARLVAMAAALLSVEDRLEQRLLATVGQGVDAAAPEAAGDGGDPERGQVIQAVMRECLANLARIKDAISSVTERNAGSVALDAVPQLLRGITSALLIIEMSRAAEIAERIGRALGGVVDAGDSAAGRPALERLADAIVSLEYYMETIHAGRREPQWMLDNAVRCLDSIEAAESVIVPVEVEFDTSVESPATAVVTPPEPAVASAAAVVAGGENIDPEILELFIEEAREAIEAINASFPSWEIDEDNRDALHTVRRAFHTLKGSGRMVGAERIGQYSWSIEHLLNRVIDGTVPRTPSLLAFLRRAIGPVGELLEQIEVGQPPSSDIDGLMAEAAQVARGEVSAPAEEELVGGDAATEILPAIEIEAALGKVPIEETTPVRTEGLEATMVAEPSMDPVLLDILSREVTAHLAVVRQFLDEPPLQVPEQLFRACHTLHGSLTMAGVAAGVAVARPLHELVGLLFQAHVPVDQDVLDAVGESSAALSAIIDNLRDPAIPRPPTADLERRLSDLKADVDERAAAADEEAVDGGTVSVEVPVLPVEPELVTPPPLVSELPVGRIAPVASRPSITVGTVTPFDPEVAAIFAEEAAELLESCDAACARLVAGESEEQALAEIQRGLHTLKGGARMAGLFPMGDLSHDLETLLNRITEGARERSAETWRLVQAVLDELHVLREEIPAGSLRPVSATLQQRLSAALRGEAVATVTPSAGMTAEAEAAAEAGAPDRPAPETPEVGMRPDTTDLPPAAAGPAVEPGDELIIPAEPRSPGYGTRPALPPTLERLSALARDLQAPPAAGSTSPLFGAQREPRAAEPRDYARVDSNLLEQLLNNAGEVSITNSRLAQQMAQIHFNLAELNQTVQRLREQLRKLEMETEAQILFRHQQETGGNADFDPLELDRYSVIQQLSRGLAETASDVSSLKDLLHNLTADTESLLVQQARTANELQDGLMRTRMVPFDQHGSRLARLVRQTAKDVQKQADLVIEGSGDLDRQVLEKMLPPFEHMLRNAVIHGIEAPAAREALGKPAAGTIRIAIRREGSEVVIDISDDGRGLDVAAIRQKAIALGFIDPESPITDDEAMQFILRSGFSTADQITQSAGRGIGMDVVASQVARLGGTLSISSERNRGTTFTLRLPFTLAITQALIVRAGLELYALPLPTVEGIIRISRRDFDEKMARPEPSIEYGGQRYLFRHLGQFLGVGPSRLPEDQERLSLILVRAGESSTALVADEMLDSREIVVKPVGAQLATIRGISGATILGDGRVVVILDVGALVRMARSSPVKLAPLAPPAPSEPTAMVVDDSITMRRVTQRLLERNGFRVVTAKDGVEAISVLQDHRPDIILLDVEMPRMDGYEFARYVRNNAETARVPIIMVTSRVSDKHRARAIEIGVNDYLGKPYHERQLMEAVQHLLVPD